MKFSKNLFAFLFIVLAISTGRAQTSWFWQNPHPQGYGLQDGKFLNASTGFAAGKNGTIIKTTDGGNNWSIIYSDSNVTFNTFKIINSNAIFVAGSKGVILKSINLGISWINKSLSMTEPTRLCSSS